MERKLERGDVIPESDAMMAAIIESVEVVPLPAANGTWAAGEVVVDVLAAGAARRKMLAVTPQQRGRDALTTANAPEGMPVRARDHGAAEHVLMRRCVGAWAAARLCGHRAFEPHVARTAERRRRCANQASMRCRS